MIKAFGTAFAPIGAALGAMLLVGVVASVALTPFEASIRELLKSMAACPALPVRAL
jgi:hypothetical protein